jgi:hypothetical protein
MPTNALDLIFGAVDRSYVKYSATVIYSAEGQQPWTTTPPPFGEQSKEDFPLQVEAAVMVPSTRGANVPISDEDFQKRVRKTEHFFSTLCGGFTSHDAEGGYWSDDKGKLIKEKVKRVGSFCPIKSWKANRGDLRDWLKAKKKEWGQEAIGFEFEGDLYFV